ncbi:MAG: hypothetical protein JSS25_10230 [Proteobacteria bacterium]|nr:hypothetical protein [Pseudomonadota bacterium]
MHAHHRLLRATALAAALATLVVLPAGSAPSAPKTQVWIDVATHSMAGMPDMGGLGGFMMRKMAGGNGPQGYPQSRKVPATQGKLLDIAMYNSLKPGTPAEDFVPAGLDVGKSLPLLPPPPGQSREQHGTSQVPDVEVTIRQYWGCGANVRPGQPKVLTARMKGGKVGMEGGIAPGLFVPDRDIDSEPKYALWPNQKNDKRVSDDSSMVGTHRISGDGVPESLKFDLGESADFMPRIALTTQGAMTDSIEVSWQPVARARGYFLTAMAMQDEHHFVVWSSSEVAGAGPELLNYLSGSNIDKWTKQHVLLPTTAGHCAIPKGIFASEGGKQGMGAINMIAYGPETNIAYPPRPANPKQAWNPEWNVRVRTKSTATAMLGMDMSGMQQRRGEQRQGEQPQQENGAKKLLKGLFRRN